MWKIIVFFLILIVEFVLFYLYNKEKNKNKEIYTINQKIQQENQQIENRNLQLIEKTKDIQNIIEQKQKILDTLQQSIAESEQISKKAFENYIDVLDIDYFNKEKEYQESLNLLNESYQNIQNNLIAETRSNPARTR